MQKRRGKYITSKIIPKMSKNIFRKTFSTYCKLQRKVTPNNLQSKQKSVSSNQWLSRLLSDPYVEKAKQLNYRCRSAFKLIEIDEKYKILQPGHVVIDVGASPGSWSQVIANKINSDGHSEDLPKGMAVAIDKQNIYPINGVTIFGNMDFMKPESHEKLINFLGKKCINTVVSDMAPSATGVREMDNANIIKLCYTVLKFSLEISEKNASLLIKLWQCEEIKKLESDIANFYNKVNIVKPKSSRSNSAEIFILGREFKGLKNR